MYKFRPQSPRTRNNYHLVNQTKNKIPKNNETKTKKTKNTQKKASAQWHTTSLFFSRRHAYYTGLATQTCTTLKANTTITQRQPHLLHLGICNPPFGIIYFSFGVWGV